MNTMKTRQTRYFSYVRGYDDNVYEATAIVSNIEKERMLVSLIVNKEFERLGDVVYVYDDYCEKVIDELYLDEDSKFCKLFLTDESLEATKELFSKNNIDFFII